MILQHLFGRKKPDPSSALYATIVAAARQPKFYAAWQVPDTLDGRFDMLVLHFFLAMDRMREFGTEAVDFRQALTDRFFAEMDAALREVGVGDLVVGKKVRKMAEAYFGRATAYTTAMAIGENEMRDAIARNIFPGTEKSSASDLAKWCFEARKTLATFNFENYKSGNVKFEL
jgi:cytochrome b pre-mRNA-processing protein 3